jgi:hypothetical protein
VTGYPPSNFPLASRKKPTQGAELCIQFRAAHRSSTSASNAAGVMSGPGPGASVIGGGMEGEAGERQKVMLPEVLHIPRVTSYQSARELLLWLGHARGATHFSERPV